MAPERQQCCVCGGALENESGASVTTSCYSCDGEIHAACHASGFGPAVCRRDIGGETSCTDIVVFDSDETNKLAVRFSEIQMRDMTEPNTVHERKASDLVLKMVKEMPSECPVDLLQAHVSANLPSMQDLMEITSPSMLSEMVESALEKRVYQRLRMRCSTQPG